MKIEKILDERKKWFEWKNIKPIYEKIEQWKTENKKLNIKNLKLSDVIEIDTDANEEQKKEITTIAKMLKPWRKGPFRIDELFIDSEWKSYIKWNSLKPHLNLKNKDVLDVGGNNGYYAFRMLEMNPKSIEVFDPSALFNLQFDFINFFVKSNIKYRLLGVEHTPFYEKKFDTIFCMGVLYHRRDPIEMLKWLKQGLKKGGEIILDTMITEGNEEVALSPVRYAKMKNIYFIPTLKTLCNWIEKANFSKIEFLGKRYTTTNEQRKTDWIDGESLENFLNKNQTKTIEGYEPPLRCYLKISY